MLFFEAYGNWVMNQVNVKKVEIDLKGRDLLNKIDKESVRIGGNVFLSDEDFLNLVNGLDGYKVPTEEKIKKQRKNREKLMEKIVTCMSRDAKYGMLCDEKNLLHGVSRRIFTQFAPTYLSDKEFEKWIEDGADIGPKQHIKNGLVLMEFMEKYFPEGKAINEDDIAEHAHEIYRFFHFLANSVQHDERQKQVDYLKTQGLTDKQINNYMHELDKCTRTLDHIYHTMNIMADPIYDCVDAVQIFENEKLCKKLVAAGNSKKIDDAVDDRIDDVDQRLKVMFSTTVLFYEDLYKNIDSTDKIIGTQTPSNPKIQNVIAEERIQFAHTEKGKVLMFESFDGNKINDITGLYNGLMNPNDASLNMDEVLAALDKGNMIFKSQDSEYGKMWQEARNVKDTIDRIKSKIKEYETKSDKDVLESIGRDFSKASPEEKRNAINNYKKDMKLNVVAANLEMLANDMESFRNATNKYFEHKGIDTYNIEDQTARDLGMKRNAVARVDAAIACLKFANNSKPLCNIPYLEAIDKKATAPVKYIFDKEMNLENKLKSGKQFIEERADEAKEVFKIHIKDNGGGVKKLATEVGFMLIKDVIETKPQDGAYDKMTLAALSFIGEHRNDEKVNLEEIGTAYLKKLNLYKEVIQNIENFQANPNDQEAKAFVDDLSKGGKNLIEKLHHNLEAIEAKSANAKVNDKNALQNEKNDIEKVNQKPEIKQPDNSQVVM